jgi:type IV secretion system protein VirD4
MTLTRDERPVVADDIGADLAIAAVLVLGGAGFVCWSGAQLAALAFRAGIMKVGPTFGAAALIALPHHLSNPARAWPPYAREALPGAVAYWLATSGATAVALAIAWLAVQSWRRWNRGASPLGVRPNAGLARRRDLRRMIVARPVPGRLTLGWAGRRLVAAEPTVSLAVVGPTGCGKTAGFAIPALLEWSGPIIATSVKGDLLDAALEHRRRCGRVWIYDPTHAWDVRSDTWSPLTACTTWHGAMRVAAWLCEAAQPRTDTVNDSDYWYSQARKALAPYLHAAALANRTIGDVVRWIDTQESDAVADVLTRHGGVHDRFDQLNDAEQFDKRRTELHREIQEHEIAVMRDELVQLDDQNRRWVGQPIGRWPTDQHHELATRVDAALNRRITAEMLEAARLDCQAAGTLDPLIAAEALRRKEPRLRGSVFATVENVVHGYADPGVADAATGQGIDLRDWLSGNNTIFVVAPAHEQARLRPVLTVLVQQAVRTAYETANNCGGSLPRPCLVLLDEAGNIAPLRDLPTYASTARSHGITLVSIWQDLAQLKAIYGEQAHTVLNNHQAKLFGAGIADDATLEYVSRLIGDQRHTELNRSRDLRAGRQSINEQVTYRRATPADVLRRIRTNEAVLVYGNELPAHVRLRPWFAAPRPIR